MVRLLLPARGIAEKTLEFLKLKWRRCRFMVLNPCIVGMAKKATCVGLNYK